MTGADGLEGLVRRALPEAAAGLSDVAVAQLAAYLRLLARWNKAYNLTSVRDPADMATRHVGDSLTALPFLAGDRFTAADIAFCALGAPMVMPPEYGGPLPAAESLPSDVQTKLRRWIDHPAGQYILRMYASHRNQKAKSTILAP